jgi:hypothetical protein
MPSDEDEQCIMLDGIILQLVTLLSPDSLQSATDVRSYGVIMYIIAMNSRSEEMVMATAYMHTDTDVYGIIYGVVLIRFSLPEKHVVWEQRHRLRARACRMLGS